MSSFKVLAAAAILAAAPTALAGTCTVSNQCPFPVYVTKSQLGTDGPQQEFQNGNSFVDNISGQAVSLKIMTEPGFCGTNCIQLEYSQDTKMNLLFYDLSNINAQALAGFLEHGLTVNNSDPSAQQISCPGGTGKCTNTYYQWFENENTFSSSPDADITVNLCNGASSGSSSGSSISSAVSSASAAPAPVSHAASQVASQAVSAPSSAASSVAAAVSSAASAPSAATTDTPMAMVAPANGGPVVEVTVTHTVAGRAEETAAAERRHLHQHAHVHHNRH